jgi:hypothetical protein
MATDVLQYIIDVESSPWRQASSTVCRRRCWLWPQRVSSAWLFLNFHQERNFQQPDDGVWWREANGGLTAERVLPGMPGQARRHSGPEPKTLLTAVLPAQLLIKPRRVTFPGRPILSAPSVIGSGAGPLRHRNLRYAITRDGIPLDTPVVVIPVPLDRSLQLGAALYRPGLSGHRHLRAVSPLDGATRHALLHFLPGLIRALFAEVHGQTGRAGLDRSSGATCSRRRCSRRCSCTLRSASPRSG